MLKDASGGNGMPTPLEVPAATALLPPVGMDRSFSKKNPPGFGKETSLGAATAVERLTSPIDNTLEYETNGLYAVQEQLEEEVAEEEMKVPKHMEAMDTEQESAAMCRLLSLMSKKPFFTEKHCHATRLWT
jgi:hypothetical protein